MERLVGLQMVVTFLCGFEKKYEGNIKHPTWCLILHPLQGLIQTFLSSGPQDHQLRESGGPENKVLAHKFIRVYH